MPDSTYPTDSLLDVLKNDLNNGNLLIQTILEPGSYPRRILVTKELSSVRNSVEIFFVIDSCLELTTGLWNLKAGFTGNETLSNLISRFGYTPVFIGGFMSVRNNTVDFGNSYLKGVLPPIADTDVATKGFVEIETTNVLNEANTYTDTAIAASSLTLTTSINNVQSQVTDILAGSSLTTDTLAEVALLAQTLTDAENASLVSSVSNLQSQINTNTADISANTIEIIALQSEINTNTADISANTIEISVLQSEINTNTADISANTIEISALQTLTTSYATEFDTLLIKSTDPSSVVGFGSNVDLQYNNIEKAQLVDTSTLQVSDVTSDSFDGLVLSPDDCKFYPPNQIVLLETADICPDQDSTSTKFNGWILTGVGIPPNTFIKDYRYDYSNWSSIYRCMYANLSNDIDDPSGFNYSYKLVKPISIQSPLNFNSFLLSNIADGVRPSDACSLKQLTEYKLSNDSSLAIEIARARAAEAELQSFMDEVSANVNRLFRALYRSDAGIDIRPLGDPVEPG
jgi:hypothetical protein